MMKKLLSVFLLCAMLLSLLASCKQNGTGEEATTAPPAEEKVEDLVLVADGKTSFRIIYNQMEVAKNPNIEEGINKLVETVKKHTGVKLQMVASAKAPYDANSHDILIGSTGYEESLAAAKDLRLTDYALTRSGNKVVVVGGNIASLSSAITYFTSKIVTAQVKNTPDRIVFGAAQEHLHEGTYLHKSITVNGVDLKDFTIVIPKEYNMADSELANYLHYNIGVRYGYLLPIENDSKEYAHEILIGNTARTTVKPDVSEHVIEITDKNVQICAGSMAGYGYLDDLFYRFLVNGKVESVKEDAYDKLSADKDSILKREGELRIIFHNVLAYDHPDREGDMMGPTLRWQIQADLYKEYDPDLLCLQEFNNVPRSGIKNLKNQLTSLGYAEVPFENPDHGDTPIFYKPDKVELLKYGSYDYKTPNNDNERYGGIAKMATWGVFKDKNTGKMFVLFSAHLDHQDNAEANARRALEALELLDLMNNTICTGEYAGLPIILGGDINTSYNRENKKYGTTGALNNFEGAGFKDAQKTLDFAEKISSYGGYPSYTDSKGYIDGGTSLGTDPNDSLDHCLYKGNVTFHSFDVMNHEYARKASDHLPLVVDVTLP